MPGSYRDRQAKYSGYSATHPLCPCSPPPGADFTWSLFPASPRSPMPLKATYAASKRFLLDFSLPWVRTKGSKYPCFNGVPGGLYNPDSLEGIAAQGMWGRLTTNRVELVANRSISKVLAGNGVYVPGIANCLLGFAGAILPRQLIAKLLYHRWSTARKNRMKMKRQVFSV